MIASCMSSGVISRFNSLIGLFTLDFRTCRYLIMSAVTLHSLWSELQSSHSNIRLGNRKSTASFVSSESPANICFNELRGSSPSCSPSNSHEGPWIQHNSLISRERLVSLEGISPGFSVLGESVMASTGTTLLIWFTLLWRNWCHSLYVYVIQYRIALESIKHDDLLRNISGSSALKTFVTNFARSTGVRRSSQGIIISLIGVTQVIAAMKWMWGPFSVQFGGTQQMHRKTLVQCRLPQLHRHHWSIYCLGIR